MLIQQIGGPYLCITCGFTPARAGRPAPPSTFGPVEPLPDLRFTAIHFEAANSESTSAAAVGVMTPRRLTGRVGELE